MAKRILVLPDGSTTQYDSEEFTEVEAIDRAREMYPDAFGDVQPEAEPPSAWRRVPDVGIAALKTAVALPETVAGLLDIFTGGRVGRGLESLGVRFAETQKILDDLYSPQQKAANAAVRNADGFVNTLVAASENPSAVLATIGESAAPMLAGGVLARGGMSIAKVANTARNASIAAAAGEGTMMAGSAAEGIRQQTEDGLLDARGIEAALGTGVLGAVAGRAGAKMATKFGVGDIDTAIAQGMAKKTDSPGFFSALVKGGVSEGAFEEMPQSIQEQMWQNYALGRPVMEHVGNAAGMGLATGSAMGGTFNAAQSLRSQQPDGATGGIQPEDTATPSEYVAIPQGGVRDMFSGDITVVNQEEAQPAPPVTPVRFTTADQGQMFDSRYDVASERAAAMEKAAAEVRAKQTARAANKPQEDSSYILTPEKLKEMGLHRGNKRLSSIHDALVGKDIRVDGDAILSALSVAPEANLSGKTIDTVKRVRDEIQAQMKERPITSSAQTGFGQMNELAALAEQEKADVNARRAGIVAEQEARKAAAVERADQVEKSKAETAAGLLFAQQMRDAREADAKRAAILDAVLERNPTNVQAAFKAELRRQGYPATQQFMKDSELDRMAQYQRLTEALADEPPTPNEMDVEALIPEKKAKPVTVAPQVATRKPRTPATPSRAPTSGRQFDMFGGTSETEKARAASQVQIQAEEAALTDFASKRDFPRQQTLSTKVGKPMPKKGTKDAEQVQAEEAALDPAAMVRLATKLNEISKAEKNSASGKKARAYINAAKNPLATVDDMRAADAFVKDYNDAKAQTAVDKVIPQAKKPKVNKKAAEVDTAEETLAQRVARLRKEVKDLSAKLDEIDVDTPAYRVADLKLKRAKVELTKAVAKTKEAKAEEDSAVSTAYAVENLLDVTRKQVGQTGDSAFDALDGEATAVGALDVIAAKSGDTEVAELAAVLKDNEMVQGAKVVYTDQSPTDPNTGNRIFGQYHAESNTIYLHNGSTAADFLHEVTHARTYHALRADPVFRNKIQSIRDEAIELAKEQNEDITDIYGFTDGKYALDEFVAETYGNPQFASFLKGLRKPAASAQESTFFKMLHAFMEAIGLRGKKATPAMIDLVSEVMSTVDKYADKLGSRNTTSGFGTTMLNVARTTPEQVMAKQKEAVKGLTTVAKDVASSVTDVLKLNSMTLQQIGQSYGNKFKDGSLKRVLDEVTKRSVTRTRYVQMGDAIGNDFLRNVDREFMDRAFSMMSAATISEVFPDLSFEENVKRGVPDTDEMRSRWDAVSTEFNKLKQDMDTHKSGSGKRFEDVFRKMYEHGSFLFDEKLRIIADKMDIAHKKQLEIAEKSGQKRQVAKLLREQKEFEERMGVLRNRLKGPYFPLARFGDNLVVFESEALAKMKGERNAAHEELVSLESSEDLVSYDAMKSQVAFQKRIVRDAKKGSKRHSEAKAALDVMESALAKEEEDVADLLKKREELRDTVKNLDSKIDLMVSEVDETTGEGKHYIVEAYEFEWQAKRALRKYADKYGEGNVRGAKAREYAERASTPATRQFMEHLSSAITGTMDAADAAHINTLMATVMTELSVNDTVRRQMKRKKVAGFDKDMFRGFMRMVMSDAHFLSTLKHSDDVRRALTDMSNYEKKQRGSNFDMSNVVNAVDKHVQGQVDYAGKNLSGKVSAFTSAWMLLTSPAYIAINMTQPWVVSLPMIASMTNPASATGALRRSMANAMRIVKASADSADKDNSAGFVRKWSNVMVDVESVRKVAGDESASLMEYLLDRQLIDISLTAEAGLTSSTGSSVGEVVTKAIGAAPHLTEVTNRIGTAFAAYEEAKKASPNATQEELYAAVERVLDNTHFNYSAENEPLAWKRIPFAHVVLQFKKYQEGMIYLVLRNAAIALGKVEGASAREIKAAKATLGYLAATHFAAAGAIGVPASGALMFAIDMAMAGLAAATGSDDEPWKSEEELRKALAATFNDDVALLVSKGLPAYLGLDLSQRLGAGDIASVFRMPDDSAEGADWYRKAVTNALGPFFGGVLPRAADGANYLAHGDLAKGFEKMAPSIVANTMRAYRYGTEGLTTKYGRMVVPADDFSVGALAIRAAGFTTEKEREYYEAQREKRRREAFYESQRRSLQEMYNSARESKEGMQDVIARMREINAARIEKGVKPILFSQLVQSYMRKMRQDRTRTASGVLPSRVLPEEF